MVERQVTRVRKPEPLGNKGRVGVHHAASALRSAAAAMILLKAAHLADEVRLAPRVACRSGSLVLTEEIARVRSRGLRVVLNWRQVVENC
jgi:hypothetical protein